MFIGNVHRHAMLLRRPHDLATILQEARLRAGLSQRQLAERVGASRQWISLVETGKITVAFDLVFDVLRALGCRVSIDMPGEAFDGAAARTLEPETGPREPRQRTRLTRRGVPLGARRTSRPPKRPGGPGAP